MKTPFLYKKSSLKITSCILGYSIWLVMSSSHTVTTWITAPLYFYNVAEHLGIDAPPTVNIQVQGPRAALRQLQTSPPPLHINAAQLQQGTHIIAVSSALFFVPSHVQILESSPRSLELRIIHKNFPNPDTI